MEKGADDTDKRKGGEDRAAAGVCLGLLFLLFTAGSTTTSPPSHFYCGSLVSEKKEKNIHIPSVLS